MRVVGVDVAVCPMGMPHPVVLGQVVIRTRDFVVLRLRTDGEVVGYAIGYPRGTPLFDALVALGPQLIGKDPLMRREVLTFLERSNIPGRIALVRAFSAIDVALWDLASKAAGLLLYQMLGGYRRQVPVMAVAGYFGDVRSVQDIEEEVRQLAGGGYRQIKLVISGTNPRADYELMARLRKAVDASVALAVDAHWTWHSLDEALTACRMLDEVGLAFIEDPFTPQQWRLTRELQAMIRTPLAVGEDVVDLQEFRDLLEGVTVLRVDATASGGLTGVVAATAMAAIAGRSVIPHVFTSLHGQLGGWSPAVSFVETILPQAGADPIDRLLARVPHIIDGHLVLEDEPGNGVWIDWQAVTASASRTFSAP